jgi:hypothetical protein
MTVSTSPFGQYLTSLPHNNSNRSGSLLSKCRKTVPGAAGVGDRHFHRFLHRACGDDTAVSLFGSPHGFFFKLGLINIQYEAAQQFHCTHSLL